MNGNNHNNMTFAVIAILAALAMLGVTILTVVIPQQEAEAVEGKGCGLGLRATIPIIASQGRCYFPS
jgi:hypothetical protein